MIHMVFTYFLKVKAILWSKTVIYGFRSIIFEAVLKTIVPNMFLLLLLISMFSLSVCKNGNNCNHFEMAKINSKFCINKEKLFFRIGSIFMPPPLPEK